MYNAQASFRKEFCVRWPGGRGIDTMAQPGLLVLWGVMGLEGEELNMARRSHAPGEEACVKRRRSMS